MNRRALWAALTGAAALVAATGAVAQTADNFPNRPIRIIVPQAAGSGIDLQARTLAQKMGELWGQPGIVENRPGANAIIGTDAVAKAAPDGYTLVYAPVSAVTTNALIYKNLPYDPLRDFAMVSRIAKAFQDYVVNVVIQKFGANLYTDGLRLEKTVGNTILRYKSKSEEIGEIVAELLAAVMK